MTWRECLESGTGILREAGVPDAECDARILLEWIGKMSRSRYYLCASDEMPPEIAGRYMEIIRKRGQRIPLQYLTGEQEFMGLTFRVTPDVLIPRMDTEILADEVLRCLNGFAEPPVVLDLCTGSGCIAVSIAHFLPEAQVDASDISEAALRVAEQNAKNNHAAVRWIHSDLFDAVGGDYDLIVSNPPYIRTADLDDLMPEVRDHEPETALDGSVDGLFFYRKIIGQSAAYLKPGGYLYVEIGYDQDSAVFDLMQSAGYREVRLVRDLAGNPRVVCGRTPDLSEK